LVTVERLGVAQPMPERRRSLPDRARRLGDGENAVEIGGWAAHFEGINACAEAPHIRTERANLGQGFAEIGDGERGARTHANASSSMRSPSVTSLSARSVQSSASR